MKIGVAIPCTKNHIIYLDRCLKSIDNQKVKPKKVSISISGVNIDDIPKFFYDFKIIISFTNNTRNASMNRNIAANKLLDMDIISFMDADDEMCDTRLEYIEKSFKKQKCNYLLHNYVINHHLYGNENVRYKKYLFFINNIIINPDEKGVMVDDKLSLIDDKIHHGHVSIDIETWKKEKFYEEDIYLLWEDSEYCRRLCQKGYISCYLYTQLSIYHK